MNFYFIILFLFLTHLCKYNVGNNKYDNNCVQFKTWFYYLSLYLIELIKFQNV